MTEGEVLVALSRDDVVALRVAVDAFLKRMTSERWVWPQMEHARDRIDDAAQRVRMSDRARAPGPAADPSP